MTKNYIFCPEMCLAPQKCVFLYLGGKNRKKRKKIFFEKCGCGTPNMGVEPQQTLFLYFLS